MFKKSVNGSKATTCLLAHLLRLPDPQDGLAKQTAAMLDRTHPNEIDPGWPGIWEKPGWIAPMKAAISHGPAARISFPAQLASSS